MKGILLFYITDSLPHLIHAIDIAHLESFGESTSLNLPSIMAKPKIISLSDLMVNAENYRFDPVASQKEAIDKMIENQGDYLYNLAEHIVKNGLNPTDAIQVFQSTHDKTKYIVLEGNRRTVALRLLNNPEIIEGAEYASLKKKFKNLAEVNRDTIASIISKIDCLVYDDPQDADTWIGIKHGYGDSGVGIEKWDPLQKQRFGEKTEGSTSTSLQIIKLLKNAPSVPENIKSNIEKINTTNLDRLIGDPDVRKFLGIEFNGTILQSDVDRKEVIKGLTQIVKDVLDSNFKVKRIYDKVARKDYLNSFSKTSQPNLAIKADKPWQFNSTTTPAAALKKLEKVKVNPRDRNRLIPKGCELQIGKSKVNVIYHELRTIDINKFTNATAVLFRVFVELSVDTYMEENKLVPSHALSAAKSSIGLEAKVNMVANHLHQKKLADPAICKGIKNAVKESNDVLGVDTWHAYVHNNRFAPKPSNLIITWDNIQDFMSILWNKIK